MNGLTQAQYHYDSQEPADCSAFFRDDEIRMTFDETLDTECFIKDLAVCTEPAKWLTDNGISDAWSDTVGDVAELLQSMAITAVAGHLDIPGSCRFWRVMRRMACERFEFLEGGAA